MKRRLAVALRAASVRRGDQWVLRGITWELRPGERWALLGANGAGKTQLLKLLSGDIWPTAARSSAAMRSYRAGRSPLDLLEAKPRMAYLGGERQDKYVRYGWNLRVRDVVATGLHRTDLLLTPLKRHEARQVNAMLRECGIKPLAAREFLSLSYGERRLALLARALVQDPDWLLLDEIYNGLDAGYRRRVDAVLQSVAATGQSWVATAHRALDVPPATRLLLELAGGRVRKIKRLRATDLGKLRAQGAEVAPRAARARASRLRTASSPRAARLQPVLVRLTGVDLYVEYRTVLLGLDWRLRRGEHWSVFGANGAGKSSFLKLLYGDLSPAAGGKIERAGLGPGTPITDWKKHVGYVSPELQSLYAMDVTLLEVVASGRHSSIGLGEAPSTEDAAAALHWLKFFRLLKLARRRPRELSYGQLRCALIARALAADPQILLLDEPLTGLDARQRAAMKRFLESLMRSGVTLVIAVHHVEDLPRGMTHGLHLHKRQARIVDSYFAT